MLFKNLTPYQMTAPAVAITRIMQDRLIDKPFKPCTPKQIRSQGFVSPRGPYEEELTVYTQGVMMFCLKIHERKLPGAAVDEQVADRVHRLEDAEGRAAYKKERQGIKDDVMSKMAPNIPPTPSYVYGFIDQPSEMMFLNTGSDTVADDMITSLTVALGGCPFVRLRPSNVDPLTTFTRWLTLPMSILPAFHLGSSCTLREDEQDGAIIQVQREDIHSEEVLAHIDAGKRCCRLALRGKDLSFDLTDGLALKKLTFDDALLHAEELPTLESDLLIMADVVRGTMGALAQHLGGWPVQEAMDFEEGAA